MDSLQLNTGKKQIKMTVDGVETGIIEFNPKDVVFAEKFYSTYADLKVKLLEYQKRAEEIDKNTEVDENKIPVNVKERTAHIREIVIYVREKIDILFGAGTSQIAFGDAISLEMFEQFFNGIMPFIQKERSQKIEQYTTSASMKRNRKK